MQAFRLTADLLFQAQDAEDALEMASDYLHAVARGEPVQPKPAGTLRMEPVE